MIRSEKVEKLREKGLKLKELVMMDDETLDRRFKETVYGINVEDLKSFFKVVDFLKNGCQRIWVDENGCESFSWENAEDIKTFKEIFGLK